MNTSGWPNLDSWLKGTAEGHPLAPLLINPANEPDAQILRATDEIISTLEQAQPLRLPTKRAEFRQLRSHWEFVSLRAELVLGATMLSAGISFDFGQPRSPMPDLLPRALREVAVEVKARKVDGVWALQEELEEALAAINAPVTARIVFDEMPLGIKAEERRDLVEATLAIARTGSEGRVDRVIPQPWSHAQRVQIAILVWPSPVLLDHLRVTVDSGPLLTNHLQDIEGEVLAVLRDDQKRRQAQVRPTILVVDVTRAGRSFFRDSREWRAALQGRIESVDVFAGLGVMVQDVSRGRVSLAVALHPDANDQCVELVEALDAVTA